jgi:hypothetical protein
MRPLLSLCLALLICAPLGAANVTFVRTWLNYRDAQSFVRISEYFTGKENPGRETYLRSQPEERTGLYFLTRLKNTSEAVNGARLELNVITPESAAPKTYKFDVTIPKGEHVFQVGLTGSDWKDPKVHPVAWQIVLVDAEGHTVATHESFLWSKPDRS